MKKVIAMVGTSLFGNFFQSEDSESAKQWYEKLEELPASQWEHQIQRTGKLRSAIKNWLSNLPDKEKIKASAEIKSIFRLKRELASDLDVYLLSSDTLISKLAGEIIKESLEEMKVAKAHCRVIKDLQIQERDRFKKGMSSLITAIYEISQKRWDDVVINITGGFKATIPFLTILGQLNKCPIYYIFETTDSLIKIPSIPISQQLFDLKELEPFIDLMLKLKNGVSGRAEYEKLKKDELYKDFYERFSFFLWEDYLEGEPLVELNPIGEIFLEKYREKAFLFYATKEVMKELNSSEPLKNALKKFLKDPRNKVEQKNGHYVFDDGNNPLRILFRKKDTGIYVYKVFSNHDKYASYLSSTPYSDEILDKEKFALEKIFEEE